MTSNPLHSGSGQARAGASLQANARFTPLDPIKVLRQHATVLLIALVVSGGLSICFYMLLDRFFPRYTTEVQLSVTGGVSDPYQGVQDGTGPQTRMDMLEAYIQNQVVRLRSDAVLNDALKREEVRQTEWFKSFEEGSDGQLNAREARKNLQRNLFASQIKGSTLIRVTFTGYEQDDLQVILNTVVTVYLGKIAFESGRESDDVRLMFVRERDRAEEAQRQVQEQLRQFTTQNDLPNLENQGNEATITYRLLADEMARMEVALQQAASTYQSQMAAQQAGQVSRTPEAMAELEMHSAVSYRKERLRGLREQREVLLARFGEKHRSVREIDLQARAIEQELDRELDRLLRERQAVKIEQSRKMIDSFSGQLTGLQEKMDDARIRMRDLSDKLVEYQQIKSQAAAASERRAKAQELLDSVRIQTARPDSARVRRVLSAIEPEKTFPQAMLVVPGLTVLLTGAVTGLVFLRELFDQRIKSPADMRMLPGCDLLGVIPDASEDALDPAAVQRVILTHPNGLLAEAFRNVRSGLLARLDSYGCKTLLCVGAQGGCGTSVVISNLALGMAKNNRKVLVLDANLRRPSQHLMLRTRQQPGLVEVLSGAATLEDAVVQVDGVMNLDLLPTGQTGMASPEMLEGNAFRDLLTRLRESYDLVLIDVPPALLTSDSAVLAKQVDATMVVVRAMTDMRGMIGRVLSQISGQGGRTLGVILNGVQSSAGGYFRKNYEQFRRYHGNGDTGSKADEVNRGLLERAS